MFREIVGLIGLRRLYYGFCWGQGDRAWALGPGTRDQGPGKCPLRGASATMAINRISKVRRISSFHANASSSSIDRIILFHSHNNYILLWDRSVVPWTTIRHVMRHDVRLGPKRWDPNDRGRFSSLSISVPDFFEQHFPRGTYSTALNEPFALPRRELKHKRIKKKLWFILVGFFFF